MPKLGPKDIKVIVRGAGKEGRPTRYKRPFAGLTIKEAIRRLDSGEKGQGRLPHGIVTVDPYHLNGEEISEFSDRILQPGDLLNADDP